MSGSIRRTDVRVPDPPVARTCRGAQLAASGDAEAVVLIAQGREYADIFDLAGEAQIIVQRVRDDRGWHPAFAEVGRRRGRRREAADLPEGLVRRCQQLAGERSTRTAEVETAVQGVALVGQYRQSTGAFDGGS